MLQPQWCEARNIVFCLPPHSAHLQQHNRKVVEDFFLITSYGTNQDIFFPIYTEALSKTYNIENIKAAFKVTGIFPLNPRVVSQLWKPTAKTRSKSRSNTNRILKTFLTPSTTFGNKFSSLSNSTPFLKPILLVQSYSSCSIRSKISDLQRRTCDSLASPEVWSDDLKSDSSRYNGAR